MVQIAASGTSLCSAWARVCGYELRIITAVITAYEEKQRFAILGLLQDLNINFRTKLEYL